MQYGVSTHLYHAQRLDRAHLAEIAGAGFDAVEVFATKSHVDYHDAATLDRVVGWLKELRLRLHGIHAPIMEAFGRGDKWEGKSYSVASSDQGARQEAVRETLHALELARRIPVDVLVVHLGIPKGQQGARGSDTREAGIRSLEEIHRVAEPLGVRLAIEVIPNEISTAEALVRLLEEDVQLPGAGICLDFGHAFLMGDLVDAIEHVAGHLISTHVHDNDKRSDSHVAPFEGRIEWPPAIMELQKVGYDGTLLFELADTSSPREVLEKARRVRTRFDGLMI